MAACAAPEFTHNRAQEGDTMAESTVWWLLAGGAVALELITGTFYLLMLAVGLAAGALAAHAGAGVTAQLVAAAVVGCGAVVGWHFKRSREPSGTPAEANRDVNMDVGESVQVEAWGADNTASVRYRGANWTVVPMDGVPQGTGLHRVRQVSGNRLVVEKV
jgi:membrane protein implicated in regulation of membrane protease activity